MIWTIVEPANNAHGKERLWKVIGMVLNPCLIDADHLDDDMLIVVLDLECEQALIDVIPDHTPLPFIGQVRRI